MEMVERVAKVMAALSGAKPWPDIRMADKEAWLSLARAGIEAMREPTDTMVAAAMEETATDLRSEYRAMIDAALSQP